MQRRGISDAAASIVKADAAVRGLKLALDEKLAQRNESAKTFGSTVAVIEQLVVSVEKMLDNALFEEEIKELNLDLENQKQIQQENLVKSMQYNAMIPFLKDAVEAAKLKLEEEISQIPNLPAPDVPDGDSQENNLIVKTFGNKPHFDFALREHDAIAARLGYDPEAAAAIAGARFAVLKGGLARLHRALGQYMIDVQVGAHGYAETVVPLLVNRQAAFGTGNLPKFEDDLFKTTDGRYLIPTAEMALTNLVRDSIVEQDRLPLRLTALTPCFRSEAGSAGRDTKGLIRQHQFEKVELVSICTAAQAAAEHDHMLASAEAILENLGLTYRRMLLCAGDMGFSARKTFDLEVWLPGQGAWREISSISDCGDFQGRRMNARWKVRGEKGTQGFVNTLNGSGLAVGRTLVAIIENYQQADGSVAIPAVLHPYMGGITVLTPP